MRLLQQPQPRTLLPGCSSSAPRDLGFVPRLGDVATSFLFAGSPSSKAEHKSQRHTDTRYPQRTLTLLGFRRGQCVHKTSWSCLWRQWTFLWVPFSLFWEKQSKVRGSLCCLECKAETYLWQMGRRRGSGIPKKT